MAPHLSSDAIYAILQRLPARSLSRFRCVCRQWDEWIADPIFVEQHQYIASHRNFLFSFSIDDVHGGRIFSVHQNRAEVMIHSKLAAVWPWFEVNPLLDTCLQLICMYKDDDIYVFNPTTQELLLLPPLTLPPSRNCDVVGFGHVSSARVYKVFRARDAACNVLTLEEGCQWRAAEVPPFPVQEFWPAFANGAVHFFPNVHNKHRIAGFDLETEKWREIRPPRVIEEHVDVDCMESMMLKELLGFLCIADYGNETFSVWERVDIWMLRDYDESAWVMEYRIDLSQWSNMDFEDFMAPVLIEDDGRILMHHQDLRELHHFDPSVETFTQIDGVNAGDVARYVDGFFSLKKIIASL